MYGSFPCSAVRVCALRCDNDHGLDKSAVKIEVLMSTYKTPRRLREVRETSLREPSVVTVMEVYAVESIVKRS